MGLFISQLNLTAFRSNKLQLPVMEKKQLLNTLFIIIIISSQISMYIVVELETLIFHRFSQFFFIRHRFSHLTKISKSFLLNKSFLGVSTQAQIQFYCLLD